jgi:hypothetical protein
VQGRISYFLKQLENIGYKKFNRVIDVGCYDLSLLKAVKKKIEADYYIGIDPSIPDYCINNSEGIFCIKDYIDHVEIPNFYEGKPDLILSDQTFEHIPTINKTLSNIIGKIGKDSQFAVCVPSLEVLVEKLNFHNIIHEHVNYFSVHTLTELFARNMLNLHYYNLNYITTCGFLFAIFGSNRDDVLKNGIRQNKIDRDFFLAKYGLFKTMLERTNEMICEFEGDSIYGFGASDITANLAYFMNSDFKFLVNILDDTPYKQGRFYPFLRPEIRSNDQIEDLANSVCLITAPQAARYIYPRINSLNFKKIINPIGLVS